MLAAATALIRHAVTPSGALKGRIIRDAFAVGRQRSCHVVDQDALVGAKRIIRDVFAVAVLLGDDSRLRHGMPGVIRDVFRGSVST